MKEQYVPKEVKKAKFEGLLTPIMMYGSESWTMTTRDRSRIQASEMKTLRTIVHKTRRYRVRNVDVRGAVGVGPMMNKIEMGQLRWLGHLMRMDEDRIARRRWDWTPDGRRSRGRPRKRWRDGIEDVLAKHSMPTIEQLRRDGIFEDRREWIRRLTSLTG